MSEVHEKVESDTTDHTGLPGSWIRTILAGLTAAGLLGRQALRFVRMHLRLASDATLQALKWRMIAAVASTTCVALFSCAGAIALADELASWPLALSLVAAAYGLFAIVAIHQSRSWESRGLATLLWDRGGD